MNLWVKSLKQLAVLAVASFFFSCEDETSLIGFKDPKPKFNVRYIEIPISSSVILIDSLITDNKPVFERINGSAAKSGIFPINNTSLLIGEYNDPTLGTVRAEPFVQLIPVASTALDAAITHTFDSVRMDIVFNQYGYGFTSAQDFKFSIHEILGDSLDRRLFYHSYSSTAPRQFDPTPVGEFSLKGISYYDLRKEYLKTSGKDTLVASVRLTDDFGKKLFELAKTTGDRKVFINTVKGLAIRRVEGTGILGISNNGLPGVSNSAIVTRVTMYYHYTNSSGAVVNATRLYPIAGWTGNYGDPNYTSITVDRAASELSLIGQSYQSYQIPSGLRVIQSGSPVITKLDLSNFYEFADTVENIIISSAELLIEGVQHPQGMNPHSLLTYKVMKGDLFANYNVIADSSEVQSYFVSGKIFPDLKHYYVRNEDPSVDFSAAVIGYDSTKQKYSGFMTLFSQGLFVNKKKQGQINPNRIKYLALYPVTPLPAASVNRTLFNANDIKLRIYYTKPTDSNP